MYPLRRFLALAILASSLALAACGESSQADRQLTPKDFGRPTTRPANQAATGATAGSPSGSPSTASRNTDEQPPGSNGAHGAAGDASGGTSGGTSGGDRAVEAALDRMKRPEVVAAPSNGAPGSYTVDAMVGQVNGHAVYSQTIFEPIHDQLSALGRTLPRGLFRARAKELINAQLGEMITNALILGQAERDLSEEEQYGLRHMLKAEREELLRKWGSGSEYVANQNLIEKTGKTLDQMIDERRSVVLVYRYQRAKLWPKINITRKDLERYYNDHQKMFNAPAGKTLRVIRMSDAKAADAIEAELAAGKPFAEVAHAKTNRYQPDKGGLWPSKVTTDEVFSLTELNEALGKLKAGEHSPRINIGNDSWWLFVESIDSGKGKTLRDVQADIEETLRRQRFQDLSINYRRKLFSEGSYNPLEQMADSLLIVALSRYSLPE